MHVRCMELCMYVWMCADAFTPVKLFFTEARKKTSEKLFPSYLLQIRWKKSEEMEAQFLHPLPFLFYLYTFFFFVM